jgi:hypothetical protein
MSLNGWLVMFALCDYDAFGLADIAIYQQEKEDAYDRI